MAFEARPDRLPGGVHVRRAIKGVESMACAAAPGPPCAQMGLGAGGQMTQSIYPDSYGVEVWDPQRCGRVFVHIANSMDWREITGEEPPPTPVSARTYSEHGFPWFSLYDEGGGDLARAKALEGVRSVAEIDRDKGFGPQQDDRTVEVDEPQVVKLGRPGSAVAGGDW
jgi:hypothetical protein